MSEWPWFDLSWCDEAELRGTVGLGRKQEQEDERVG